MQAHDHSLGSGPWRRALLLPGVALLFGMLYGLGSAEIYAYADDSLPFANLAFQGGPVNVHHLMLSLLHQVSRLLGVHRLETAILLFKGYVALCSVACLLMVGSLARRWFGSSRAAAGAMCACALAFGYWTYSITTDLYVPATAFALLVLWLLDAAEDSHRATLLLLLASLAAVLAAINHQAYSLIAVPAVFMLLLGGKHHRSFRLRRALTFAVPALALGLGSFLLAFRVSGDTSFWHFLRGYQAWMAMLPYDTFQLQTPLYVLIGVARAYVFPDYALWFAGLYRLVQNKFALKFVMDDRYLVADLSPPLVVAFLVLAALACLALLFLAVVVTSRGGFRHRPVAFYALLGWVAVQALLFAVWEPTSNEFWIWLIPCIALLIVAPAIERLHRSRAAWVPWLAILCLALSNLPVFARYASSDRCIYRVNKAYLNRLTASDLVVSGDGYPSDWLRTLYNPAPPVVNFYLGSFAVRDSSLQQQAEKTAARGGRVFLDPTLVMPNEAELKLLDYFVSQGIATVGAAEAAEGLLQFEDQCQRRQLPLFGVVRRGGEVVPFVRRSFGGWLRYVHPDSVNAAE